MRTSPLDKLHRSLDAKMVPFGGWEMPLSYPGGTIEEHEACRSSAVAFDVSHLGTVRVEGPAAMGALQAALTNDLAKVEPGRAQYTHLLDDEGSVLDDIIVWWIAEETFDVMPNASNTDGVVAALAQASEGADISIAETTADRAVIAIQGPEARERFAALSEDAAATGRFRVGTFTWQGAECTVAGTGYTGEDGIECAVPVAVAGDFWKAVTGQGVRPAGLGARDTLRLEAGLPLHGHELGPGITPLNAGLGWVVAWDKGDFRGRQALIGQREGGVDPVLRGLRLEGRRPPRAGQDVLEGERVLGRVTSGNFSPVLGCGIAMALLEPSVQVGDRPEVDVRGTRITAEVVEMPFVKR